MKSKNNSFVVGSIVNKHVDILENALEKLRDDLRMKRLNL